MAESNKKSAIDFLELVVVGNIDQAYQRYVDTDGKHHNAFFGAGFVSLRDAMKQNQSELPNKQMDIRHVVAEGDFVVVHSRITPKTGAADFAAVHIFLFQNGKIAEMWDLSQPVPFDNPNKDGMF